MGGVFELGNPEGRGAEAVLEIQVDGGGGGGSKNRAFRRGGVDFFCNNPIIFPFFLGQLWSLESFRWLFRPIRNSYTEF